MDRTQQTKEILKKYNLQDYVPPDKQSAGSVDLNTRFAELDAIANGGSLEKRKSTIPEKIADVTGGKEIAQGLGQALAMRGSKKVLDESLNETIKQQSTLLQQRKKIKDAGGDVSVIDKALASNSEHLKNIGEGANQLLNPNQLTNKQIIGDALQLATTAGGANVAGAVAGKATQATGIGAGMLQGAKTGAIAGGALGGLTGVSQGLQDDLTGQEIAGRAVKGAIGGAVGGAVLGGITGGISGGINKSKQSFLKDITPDVEQFGNKEYQKLITQGKILPKTSTAKAQYVLSDDEIATATKYRNLIKKDPVQTTTNIGSELAKQDADVGTFLRSNNGIFNKGELKNYITKNIEDISDVTIDDKQFTKAKDKLVNNFLGKLKKNDMESLWSARKEFDSAIDKAFGSSATNSQIKVAFRNAVQDFISERTPNSTYANKMAEMTKLYRIRDNVLRKAVAEKGQSAIRKWIQENPLKAQVIGWTGGTVLLDKLID